MVPPRPGEGLPTSGGRTSLHFHYASRFVTQALAYMLDSLVRVPRRDGLDRLVSISNGCATAARRHPPDGGTACCPPFWRIPASGHVQPRGHPFQSIGLLGRMEGVSAGGYNAQWNPQGAPPYHLPPTLLLLPRPMLTRRPPKCFAPDAPGSDRLAATEDGSDRPRTNAPGANESAVATHWSRSLPF